MKTIESLQRWLKAKGFESRPDAQGRAATERPAPFAYRSPGAPNQTNH
jgi:hypothetical protein